MKRYQNLQVTGSFYLTGSIVTPQLTASFATGVLAATASYATIAQVAIGADPIAITNAIVTVYTSSTHTGASYVHNLDSRTKYVEVEAVGAGGGSGGPGTWTPFTGVISGGGSSGEYVVKAWSKEQAGNALNVVIGTGGTAGTYNGANPTAGTATTVTPTGTQTTALVAAGGYQGTNQLNSSQTPQIAVTYARYNGASSNYDQVLPAIVGNTFMAHPYYTSDNTNYTYIQSGGVGNVLSGIVYSYNRARGSSFFNTGITQYDRPGMGGQPKGVKPYDSTNRFYTGVNGSAGAVIVTEYIVDQDI